MTHIPKLSVRRKGSQSCSPRGIWESVGGPSLLSSPRSIILIHGFATSEDDADGSYSRLVEKLEELAARERMSRLGRVFAFHWPGDHPNTIHGALTFSMRISTATDAGHLLGEYLSHVQDGAEVFIVAHSLGCRVALAAMDALRQRSTNRRLAIRVILMAAAVPISDCDLGGDFGLRVADHYAVMHSRRDRVLQLLFPIGNYLFERTDAAVGRNGGPRGDRWNVRHETGLGHGKYWTSDRSAEKIADLLGPLHSRVPERWEVGGGRELEVRRALDRRLPERKLGDGD